MDRAGLAREIVGLSNRLSALHRTLPIALAAKANTYAEHYYDALSDGQSATAARDQAAIAAREHTAEYERVRADIEAVAEELSTLKFLVEQGLVDGLA